MESFITDALNLRIGRPRFSQLNAKLGPIRRILTIKCPATGPIIAEWRTHGAIAPRNKGLAITMMLAVFSASIAMGIASLVLIIQGICMVGAAAFILSRPNSSG